MTNKQKIEILIKKFNIPVEKIAVAIGVSWKTIYRWKKETKKPHRIFQRKLDNYYRLITERTDNN